MTVLESDGVIWVKDRSLLDGGGRGGALSRANSDFRGAWEFMQPSGVTLQPRVRV